MKRPIIFALGAVSAALLSSCVTAPTMQPRADVESVERQAPIEPTPNVGQHQAGRNAVDYANDRTSYGYGYGGYYRHHYGY